MVAAESLKDDDGDGVANDAIDQCPDHTPAGESVDAQGCCNA